MKTIEYRTSTEMTGTVEVPENATERMCALAAIRQAANDCGFIHETGFWMGNKPAPIGSGRVFQITEDLDGFTYGRSITGYLHIDSTREEQTIRVDFA